MPNFNPYSNYGYAALIKETPAVAATTPTNYLKIVSESIVPNFDPQKILEIAGSRERNNKTVQGGIEVEGDIVFYADEKMTGHFLRAVYGAPTTQIAVAATSYRHVFTVGDNDKTYTLDLQPADAPWVHRYFGVHVGQLVFEPEDNAVKGTATVVPTRAFICSRVLTAVSSGTALHLDQTTGLTTSDTILVLKHEDGYTTVAEYTIAAIVDETHLTVSAIGDQLDVNDIVVIKRAAVTESSYVQGDPFQVKNGMAIYTGTDVDNTTETPKESFNITIGNDLEKKFGTGIEEIDRYPFAVLVKGYTATGSVTKYYDSEGHIDDMRKQTDFGIRFYMEKDTAISANSSAKASSVWGSTANGFKIEATTAGRAGNDYNVTIVLNDSDDLAASISGKNILIELAKTTVSKNTGTLIASAVDALSGVNGTAEGSGVEQWSEAEDNTNLGIRSANTNVVGMDASEKPYLQFDFAAANIGSYFPNMDEDNIIPEEIPLTFMVDSDDSDDQRKHRSTRIFLFNNIASY